MKTKDAKIRTVAPGFAQAWTAERGRRHMSF